MRMREEVEYINDSEMLTTDSGLQMNDDGEVVDSAVSANGYEASMAERKVEKSQKAGGKIYGFYGAAGLRTSGRGLDNDPFRPVDRATKAEVAAGRAGQGAPRSWGIAGLRQRPSPEESALC